MDGFSEDVQVIGKVLTALGDLPLLLEELLPVTQDLGPHRLYTWQVLSRDDEPLDVMAFQNRLEELNRFGAWKPRLYLAEDYPAEYGNFTRTYLTVYI